MYVIEQLTDINLRNQISQYVAHLTTKGRKPSTIKRYLYDLNDFFQWLTTKKIPLTTSIWHTIADEDYRNYFFTLQHERHYSEKTIHRMSVALHKYMKFLVEIGFLSKVPFHSNSILLPPERHLKQEDFLTNNEIAQLKYIVGSLDFLSEKQLQVRPLLLNRNQAIFMLLMDYGITLQELISLQMNHLNLHKNELTIPPVSGLSRCIQLKPEDKQLLYHYLHDIPEPVRPRYHSTDPLFVAFDFNRSTYRWVYEDDAPKGLTEIATQKMIRLEVKRGSIRKGVSAQHFRNTFILNLLRQQYLPTDIMKRCGLKAKLTLKRYEDYLQNEQKPSTSS